MNFDQAFQTLLRHEGGFSNHAADPGKATMYGITEAVAREIGYKGDMRELPLDLAKRIYLESYWLPAKCPQLPADARYAVFDAAVNSGVSQSIKWLQRALDVQDDGIVGPMTLEAAAQADPEALTRRMLGQRLEFMTSLPTWGAFGKGWARRIAAILEA